jgi:CAAX protease family protein
MSTNASRENRSLKYFFLFVFILSVPIWLIGGKKLPLPVNLPFSALTAFVPMFAASILCYKRDGFDGIRELLKKAWDHHKIKNKMRNDQTS